MANKLRQTPIVSVKLVIQFSTVMLYASRKMRNFIPRKLVISSLEEPLNFN